MKLRNLEYKDAKYMLEWMHDISITSNMKYNFESCTMEDCQEFIKNSIEKKGNVHLAIADDEDEYMGTVSLKHVVNHTAEFAIVIRKKAMGSGYSKFGMEERKLQMFA